MYFLVQVRLVKKQQYYRVTSGGVDVNKEGDLLPEVKYRAAYAANK